MNSKIIAWIVAAVFGVVAIIGWIDNAPFDERTSDASELADQVQETVADLRESHDRLRADYDAVLTENTALRSLNESLKDQNSENTAALEELTSMLQSDHQDTESGYTEQISRLLEVNDALRNQLAKNQKTVDELSDRAASASNAGADAPTDSAVAQIESGDIRTRNQKLRIDAAQSWQQIEQLTTQLSDMTSPASAGDWHEISSEQLIADLQSLNSLLFEQVRASQSIIDSLADHINRITAVQNEKAPLSSTAESNSEVEVLKTYNEVLEQHVDRSNAMIARLSGHVQDFQQMQDAEQISQGSTEQSAVQAGSMSSEKNQSSNIESEVADTMSHDSASAAIAQVAVELEDQNQELIRILTAENDKLAADNTQINSELSALSNQLQAADAELSANAGSFEDIESRIHYLRTQLDYSRTQLRRQRAKYRELQFQLVENLSRDSAEPIDVQGDIEAQIEALLAKFANIRIESDVLFESGSAQLSAEGRRTLAQVATNYRDDPNRIVSIEGHTDTNQITGRLSQIYPTNWELSAARAASAARFLTSNGVPEDQLRIVGYGSLQPVASNSTEQGRRSNRRIEIRLSPILSEASAN